MLTHSRLIALQCHLTGKKYSIDQPIGYAPDSQQPLVAIYDTRTPLSRDILKERKHDMWRYREMLPLVDDQNIITLGEGYTPILDAQKLAEFLNIHHIIIKDEGNNPTGSFKARGMAMAVSKAKEWGISQFCVPTAGNAGSALAAYTAKADATAHIFMPEQTPDVFRMDCQVMGARVTQVQGSIRDAGLEMTRSAGYPDWWDVSTLKEPFRLEGKKTMGYEIAEQLNWKLPDVIIYPTGGGTGLIGIWKAFHEMLELGWIQEIPTKMVVVQIEQCNPVVKAYKNGWDYNEPYDNPGITIANGLRVPKAFGDRLIMKAIYESKGTAIDVAENDILQGIQWAAEKEGLFLSPEGAAVVMASKKLKESGFITQNETVLLINTGSPYKYIENLTL
ncbi:MAG TPA: threonine synthase [Saprospiraceae bacterium]|nr:threonine synthase [Saprospiraceae bacterium]